MRARQMALEIVITQGLDNTVTFRGIFLMHAWLALEPKSRIGIILRE